MRTRKRSAIGRGLSVAILAAVSLVLPESGDAVTTEGTYFVDSAPAGCSAQPGHTGLLQTAPPFNCAEQVLQVSSAPPGDVVATWAQEPSESELWFRGKELVFDTTADVPGELLFEVGYLEGNAFAPVGPAAKVLVDWKQRVQGGTRVDLRAAFGRIPAGGSLAIRLSLPPEDPRFRGALYLASASGPRLAMTIQENIWIVPGERPGASTIQSAINAAERGDHILVRASDVPYKGVGFTNVIFNKDVVVESERGAEGTIIDCEFNGSAFSFDGTTGPAAAVLEGIAIRNANNSAIVFAPGASATIRNCVFRDNDCSPDGWGAAIRMEEQSWERPIAIEGCTFINNRAGAGGAIAQSFLVPGFSNVSIRSSYFERNVASGGSAIAIQNSFAPLGGNHNHIEDCVFVDNVATGSGTVAIMGARGTDIHGCKFLRNVARGAGAGVATWGWGTTVSNSVFSGNRAATLGGAIAGVSGVSVVNHCTFGGNEAAQGGAVYAGPGADLHLYNSVLMGDKAGAGSEIHVDCSQTNGQGRLNIGWTSIQGGMDAVLSGTASETEPYCAASVISRSGVTSETPEIAYHQTPKVIGSTGKGGGARLGNVGQGGLLPDWSHEESTDIEGVARSSSPDLGAYQTSDEIRLGPAIAFEEKRIAFAGRVNKTAGEHELVFREVGAERVTWSVKQSMPWLSCTPPLSGSVANGEVRIPLYADLTDMSPGDYSGRIDLDLSVARADGVRNRTVSVQVVLRITREHLVASPGPLQPAINAASDGDEVIAGDGPFSGPGNVALVFRGRQLLLRSMNGPQATTIDCAGAESAVMIQEAEGRAPTFSGFTVAGCSGSAVTVAQGSSFTVLDSRFVSNSPANSGGAIKSDGRVEVRKTEFIGNWGGEGGAVTLRGSGNEFEDCLFEGNSSAFAGGAVYLYGAADSRFRNCLFRGNSSAAGGAVYFSDMRPPENIIFERCTFVNNTAVDGGGMYLADGSGRVLNSVFFGNKAEGSASSSGGAISDWVADGSPVGPFEVVNSTFHGNSAFLGGGGIWRQASPHVTVANCIVWGNDATNCGEIVPYSGVANSYIAPVSECEPPPGMEGAGSPFVSHATVAAEAVSLRVGDWLKGLRLAPGSGCIDEGAPVTGLYSDVRGSYRVVDKDPEDAEPAAPDIGAYEYSRSYGGSQDAVTKAFKNLTINGAALATGFEYRIAWQDKDPFPRLDPRIAESGKYQVRLVLMGDGGRRVELATRTVEIGPNYDMPYTFGPEHIGNWRVRLELGEDPNQYEETAPVSIDFKEMQFYEIGKEIPPPAGAWPGMRPDVDYEGGVYWSEATKRLYAVEPGPVVITWFLDEQRTVPKLVVAGLKTHSAPQFYVTGSPPVPLLPEAVFDGVNVLWASNDGSVASNQFTATREGWTVLHFTSSKAASSEEMEALLVVRSVHWDHLGTEKCTGSRDPRYPCERHGTIGTEVKDDDELPEQSPQAKRHDESCGSGFVYFPIAPYDGAGDAKAYDRANRTGQIISVNESRENFIEDDLVVVWYTRNTATMTCWPFKPVRYALSWPECGGLNGCSEIDLTSGGGSGALAPETFGTPEGLIIYNQPDRSLPGFNPNEEHASFFAAAAGLGVFPLRSDINVTDPAAVKGLGTREFTSKPWVLLKYRDPKTQGKWSFKPYHVVPGSLTAEPDAGQEFTPPYPLSQFVFGPCWPTGDDPHDGTWTDAVLFDRNAPGNGATVLKDKDSKLFFIRATEPPGVKAYYFYRLQEGYYFDIDDDGFPEKPVDTCIPWLDGLDGNWKDNQPAPLTNNVQWPDRTPTLAVGETLLDAKQKEGEPVGLPNIKDQCIVEVLYDGAESVVLFDPIKAYQHKDVPVEALLGLNTDPPGNIEGQERVVFKDLPPQLQQRLTYNAVEHTLTLKGTYIVDTGEPTLLLNTLSDRELKLIRGLRVDGAPDLETPLRDALIALKRAGDEGLRGASSLKVAEMKALSAGNVATQGYVTLAFNNDTDKENRTCTSPTVLSVIKVGCPLYTGELKVIESLNPFEEKLTLRHNGDFGGRSDDRYFEWKYLEGYPGIPGKPGAPGQNWLYFDPANSNPGPTDPEATYTMPDGKAASLGLVDITPAGSGKQLLKDRWFSVRYYYTGGLCEGGISEWTAPQLAEGWVKRVLKKVNLFDQKVKDFHRTDVDTVANMISQAGGPFEGIMPLSDDPEYLKGVGLIRLYETLLDRALKLSLDADPPDPSLTEAVLLAANRLSALYTLLGNEAYADAADPTVGFGTNDGQYGNLASSTFAFQNQADSLLEEELVLLRGRDDVGVRPFYNRLAWNFTIAEGEVAYRQVYDIHDLADASYPVKGLMTPDGEINEFDAMAMFPQGHGDAWGHYLSAIEKFYRIMTHKAQMGIWIPAPEAILVAQAPVVVDYRDERAFAAAGAARARTGAEIVSLTYRQVYEEDPELQWLGYPDPNPDRAWGLREWGARAGQAAYFDWVVGNALLPETAADTTHDAERVAADGQREFRLPAEYWARALWEDMRVFVVDRYGNSLSSMPAHSVTYDGASEETVVTFSPGLSGGDVVTFVIDIPAEGIAKIDRRTVTELREIVSQADAIRAVVDQADAGLNPLGVAKAAVPFDIDPARVANGETHFEQVQARAQQAVSNAVEVLNYASQSSQNLRRQLDNLQSFKKTVEDREADFTNRMIEIFGYPYGDDCGPGKLYTTAYCTTGPDIYHYMYVDPGPLMDRSKVSDYQLTVVFKDLNVTDNGEFTEPEVPVTYTIDTDARHGILRPKEWTSKRRASGELQIARSDLLQLLGRFEKAQEEYKNLLMDIESAAAQLEIQKGNNQEELSIIDEARNTAISLRDKLYSGQKVLREYLAKAEMVYNVAHKVVEILPKVTGMSFDILGPARGTILGVAGSAYELLKKAANYKGLGDLGLGQAKEDAEQAAAIKVKLKADEGGVKQHIERMRAMIRSEAVMRMEMDTLAEGLQQSAQRYLSTLARGQRIMDERLRFRKQTAGQIQDYRYKDMAFRVFRNDALQKYRAQFDLAARYVYLAAKAYDYETTLLDASSMAGKGFLTDIVKEQNLGAVVGGRTLGGNGLADTLHRLELNFSVLKPQLGFNNPQFETNRFSLRQELFRIRFDSGSDDHWRHALESSVVEDLWNDVPEFRKFCRPFAEEGMRQPALVIPFSTTVNSGLNFFGWPLGGGDSYYSPTNFATKVRSVGVWFSDYNATGLAQTPRVYLVPVGEDILRSPTDGVGSIRSWHVMDQKIPAPYPFSASDLAGNRGWIPAVDTVFDEWGQIRRHSDFKAYHDSGYLDRSEMTNDTRLIGRSVWNSKWLLIVPGRSLIYDPDEGLDTFINGPEVIGGTGRTGYGVSDIKLFFETYAYSGD